MLITKQNNYLKVDINSIIPIDEFMKYLKQESLWNTLDYEVYQYDSLDSFNDFILEKTIYLFHYNNSFYSLSSKNNKTIIAKRTFYDEKNPHTTQTKWYKEDEDNASEYDKKYHVDDKIILIDTLNKTFAIQNKKHGLYHGSTFYNKWINNSSNFKPWEEYKDDLLILANELIKEIITFENIESIIDLSVLDIISKSNIKTLKK